MVDMERGQARLTIYRGKRLGAYKFFRIVVFSIQSWYYRVCINKKEGYMAKKGSGPVKLIGFIIALAVIVIIWKLVLSPKNNQPGTSSLGTTSTYKIDRATDLDTDTLKRIRYWVVVQKGLSKSELESIVRSIVDSAPGKDAISVVLYEEGKEPIGFDWILNATYAPGGDWSNAGEDIPFEFKFWHKGEPLNFERPAENQ
jgi:hypothetical protein